MKDLRVVVITGLSGAGKSQALRAMEDLDFFCVDNLPPTLLLQFVLLLRDQAPQGDAIQRVAICMDIRAGAFFDALLSSLEQLRLEGIPCEVLYLDASEEALIRRFKETRRPHPLAPQGRIQEGIHLERQRLESLKCQAEQIIDTSKYSPHQLKARVRELYAPLKAGEEMPVNIVSFGYRYGIPEDADLVFDVRFLPNPHWVNELRPLSGKDGEVFNYVMQQEATEPFLKMLRELLDYLLPYYAKEGKNQLVLAIGCTGGRHRSVSVARYLADFLSGKRSRVHLEHRDLDAGEVEDIRK